MAETTKKVYRIRDWQEDHETAKSREIKSLQRVYLPNKMDDDRLLELQEIAGESGDPFRGAAYVGAWLTIVQAASRIRDHDEDPKDCGNPYRSGWLKKPNGAPHTPRSLALKSRFPVELYEEVLPVLVEIGWLEEHAAEGTCPCGGDHESTKYPSHGYRGAHATDTQVSGPWHTPARTRNERKTERGSLVPGAPATGGLTSFGEEDAAVAAEDRPPPQGSAQTPGARLREVFRARWPLHHSGAAPPADTGPPVATNVAAKTAAKALLAAGHTWTEIEAGVDWFQRADRWRGACFAVFCKHAGAAVATAIEKGVRSRSIEEIDRAWREQADEDAKHAAGPDVAKAAMERFREMTRAA